MRPTRPSPDYYDSPSDPSIMHEDWWAHLDRVTPVEGRVCDKCCVWVPVHRATCPCEEDES